MAEDREAEEAVEPKRCRRWVWLAAGFLIGAAAGCSFGIFVYPQIMGKSVESVENSTKTTEAITEAEQSTVEEVEVADAAVDDSDGTSEPKTEKSDDAADKTIDETPIITETVTSTNYLATMARRHYGRFEFWVYIYEENREKLGDPDKIEPKTVVVIPPAAKYGIDKDDPESVKRATEKARELYAPYGK